MKKTIALGLTVVVALSASVTSFANVTASDKEHTNPKGVRVEATTQGSGACRHALCKCTHYTRATGGAGKCICGHWDYVHN